MYHARNAAGGNGGEENERNSEERPLEHVGVKRKILLKQREREESATKAQKLAEEASSVMGSHRPSSSCTSTQASSQHSNISNISNISNNSCGRKSVPIGVDTPVTNRETLHSVVRYLELKRSSKLQSNKNINETRTVPQGLPISTPSTDSPISNVQKKSSVTSRYDSNSSQRPTIEEISKKLKNKLLNDTKEKRETVSAPMNSASTSPSLISDESCISSQRDTYRHNDDHQPKQDHDDTSEQESKRSPNYIFIPYRHWSSLSDNSVPPANAKSRIHQNLTNYSNFQIYSELKKNEDGSISPPQEQISFPSASAHDNMEQTSQSHPEKIPPSECNASIRTEPSIPQELAGSDSSQSRGEERLPNAESRKAPELARLVKSTKDWNSGQVPFKSSLTESAPSSAAASGNSAQGETTYLIMDYARNEIPTPLHPGQGFIKTTIKLPNSIGGQPDQETVSIQPINFYYNSSSDAPTAYSSHMEQFTLDLSHANSINVGTNVPIETEPTSCFPLRNHPAAPQINQFHVNNTLHQSAIQSQHMDPFITQGTIQAMQTQQMAAPIRRCAVQGNATDNRPPRPILPRLTQDGTNVVCPQPPQLMPAQPHSFFGPMRSEAISKAPNQIPPLAGHVNNNNNWLPANRFINCPHANGNSNWLPANNLPSPAGYNWLPAHGNNNWPPANGNNNWSPANGPNNWLPAQGYNNWQPFNGNNNWQVAFTGGYGQPVFQPQMLNRNGPLHAHPRQPHPEQVRPTFIPFARSQQTHTRFPRELVLPPGDGSASFRQRQGQLSSSDGETIICRNPFEDSPEEASSVQPSVARPPQLAEPSNSTNEPRPVGENVNPNHEVALGVGGAGRRPRNKNYGNKNGRSAPGQQKGQGSPSNEGIPAPTIKNLLTQAWAMEAERRNNFLMFAMLVERETVTNRYPAPAY